MSNLQLQNNASASHCVRAHMQNMSSSYKKSIAQRPWKLPQWTRDMRCLPKTKPPMERRPEKRHAVIMTLHGLAFAHCIMSIRDMVDALTKKGVDVHVVGVLVDDQAISEDATKLIAVKNDSDELPAHIRHVQGVRDVSAAWREHVCPTATSIQVFVRSKAYVDEETTRSRDELLRVPYRYGFWDPVYRSQFTWNMIQSLVTQTEVRKLWQHQYERSWQHQYAHVCVLSVRPDTYVSWLGNANDLVTALRVKYFQVVHNWYENPYELSDRMYQGGPGAMSWVQARGKDMCTYILTKGWSFHSEAFMLWYTERHKMDYELLLPGGASARPHMVHIRGKTKEHLCDVKLIRRLLTHKTFPSYVRQKWRGINGPVQEWLRASRTIYRPIQHDLGCVEPGPEKTSFFLLQDESQQGGGAVAAEPVHDAGVGVDADVAGAP
jgi:hypothetical protein